MSPSAISTSGLASTIKTIPLAYNVANSDESARNLVIALNPEWEHSPGDIEFVRFKDGITNTLFKAVKARPGHTQHQIDSEAVLLRAYGNGTAVLIDREREARSHSLLASHGLAPALLARFDNGLLYRFIEGSACAPEDLRRPDIWPATAQHLGQWHGVLPIEGAVSPAPSENTTWQNINAMLPGKPSPNMWTVMQKWIQALPNKTQAEKKRNAVLQGELESSIKRLGDTVGLANGDYIISHCDLLSGNVIVHPRAANHASEGALQEVSFIDYEYATPAPAAFDLANHFAEWGGFDCDYNVLPTRSQRRSFIEQYVDSYRKHASASKLANATACGNGTAYGNGVSSDVTRLMDEVDSFRGIPGLYWGIWGLIQATISQIDFDYASYADTRFGEYWAWKGEHDGSREARGDSMPLRERRWAQE